MDKYYASFEGPAEYQNMFTYMSRDFLSQNSGLHLIPYHKDVSSYKFALPGQKNEQWMQVVAYREEEFTIHALGAIGFAVDQESPISDVLKRRKIPPSPQSKDALEFMQKWMLEYTKYAALSHCWGSVQPLTLNTNTAQQLYEGISIEAFPRTFQDAFWVTQKLEIPYLWIDSLCIIQDSNDDGIHKSARMCDVYGNAYLTIAATKSKNSSEGFLRPRSESFFTDITFLGGDAPANVLSLSYAEWPHPLSTRRWAFQERYLSRRTLHFAQAQMYFECESFFEAQEEYTEPVGHPQPFNVPKREGTEQDERQIRVDWNFMVARYTQRYITMDSDKLPALGGLAARVSLELFQQGSTSEYLAELWKDNLFCYLFWLALDHESKQKEPSSYSAPSWSWASVNHAVHYH
ncbi:heterokaryon incompatibility [Fusarium agapanthi]|uniref:Heterokaryon incompatibility n=1 Tax=Fusarium agapanthi TaxID=1803897 RepID=A0A9P5EC73_9HYPO|nr:heterokaryon incompatibility [Fusarium agapanthi]